MKFQVTIIHTKYMGMEQAVIMVVIDYQVCSRNKQTIGSTNTGGNAAHSHTSNCDSKSHLPPYFALCFLMLQDPPTYSI